MKLADPVGRVYAEALFSLARTRGVVDEVGAELLSFQELARENPEIREFLATPVVEPLVKVKALRKALEGRASDLVVDFLSLLVTKRRFAALPPIVAAYQALADEHAGRMRATVRSAAPLDPALHDQIAQVLSAALRARVEIDAEVDPSLLAGAVVTVDDRIYDGSVKSRLERFRKQLIRSGRP